MTPPTMAPTKIGTPTLISAATIQMPALAWNRLNDSPIQPKLTLRGGA